MEGFGASVPRSISKGQSLTMWKLRATLLSLPGIGIRRSTKLPVEEKRFESQVIELTAVG
jgi:hypothetical protein